RREGGEEGGEEHRHLPHRPPGEGVGGADARRRGAPGDGGQGGERRVAQEVAEVRMGAQEGHLGTRPEARGEDRGGRGGGGGASVQGGGAGGRGAVVVGRLRRRRGGGGGGLGGAVLGGPGRGGAVTPPEGDLDGQVGGEEEAGRGEHLRGQPQGPGERHAVQVAEQERRGPPRPQGAPRRAGRGERRGDRARAGGGGGGGGMGGGGGGGGRRGGGGGVRPAGSAGWRGGVPRKRPPRWMPPPRVKRQVRRRMKGR